MNPKKIAYFRKGPVPLANESVISLLKQNFPDYEVEVINLMDIIKAQKNVFFMNMLHVTKEYGIQATSQRANLRHFFFGTPYMFNHIKTIVANHLSQGGYKFSFQVQSLFDASVAGLPHFLYTDHTVLANLSYPDYDGSNMYSPAWLELEKTIYQNATLNFTWSTNISRSLIEQYQCNPNKVVCVGVGSNTDVSHITINQDKYTYKNILFVGVEWERKGGPQLVEAFKKVLKTHPDARLTIVGCSPKVDVPNCRVVGRVSLEQVKQCYESASVFCMPTRREPFGVVFIEAMMHKLPIIATNIGAIPDFVKPDNGYLVPPNDVEQLAAALTDLLGNPEKCRQFGDNGYQIAVTNYTWEKVGGKMREAICAAI